MLMAVGGVALCTAATAAMIDPYVLAWAVRPGFGIWRVVSAALLMAGWGIVVAAWTVPPVRERRERIG